VPTPINSVISRLIPAVFNPHVENTPPAASPTERFPDVFVAEAQRTDISSRSYDRQLGEALARSAEQEAKGRGTVGWCYNAVADAVERQTGRFLWGGHAYQSADQFAARTKQFREVPARDLDQLPPGAIVVWGKGTSKSGHISVALGDGREASDHIAPQMLSHYGGAPARVFIPIR